LDDTGESDDKDSLLEYLAIDQRQIAGTSSNMPES
jgi:hypothetical protein